jgi:hypothetical protein
MYRAGQHLRFRFETALIERVRAEFMKDQPHPKQFPFSVKLTKAQIFSGDTSYCANDLDATVMEILQRYGLKVVDSGDAFHISLPVTYDPPDFGED